MAKNLLAIFTVVFVYLLGFAAFGLILKVVVELSNQFMNEAMHRAIMGS